VLQEHERGRFLPPDLAIGEGLAAVDGDSLGFGGQVAIHAFRLSVAVPPIFLPAR
jgi:hypothetical protein